MLRAITAAALILIWPGTGQAFVSCTKTQIAGPGARIAEEGANPVKVGKYVYAGFAIHNDVGIVTSSDWGETIGKPVILADGLGPDNLLRLAAADANVYALWQKQQPGQLHAYFAASHDHGFAGTWGSTIDFGVKRRGTLLQLSADGANVHVVYLTNDGNVTIRNSLDGGRTFSSAIRIAPAGAEIVITSLGSNVYVAWGINDGKAEVMFAVSHDGGSTFKVRNLTASRPSGANEPIFSLNPKTGRLSLVWRENSPIQGIYLQSLDGGETWSAPLVLDAPTRQFMVADAGEYIYVSYLKMIYINGTPDFEVYLTSSHDGGKSFAPGKNLSGVTGISTLDGDDERPMPWTDVATGAFRLTGVAADGVHVWNGKKGRVYSPVWLGAGRLASPASNSLVMQAPDGNVVYAVCH